MSEKAGLPVKKSESKEKGPVSSSSKTEFSQSMDVNSPVEQVLHLQRTIGNRAVTRLIQSGVLQAKLKIGQPGDVYEKEADRVAEQVMRMSGESLVNGQWSLARKEKDLVQAKGNCGESDLSSCVESHINALKGGGRPLSPATREYFEPRFGSDFSQVRLHTGSDAAAIAQEINARAFTTGRDVFFGTDQYSPETSSGKHLLAHELTHVLQQGKGQSNGIMNTIQRIPSTPTGTPFDGEIIPWSAALRRTPHKDPAHPHRNTIADLPRGHRVRVLGGSAWIFVKTHIDGRDRTGYVSHELIRQVAGTASPTFTTDVGNPISTGGSLPVPPLEEEERWMENQGLADRVRRVPNTATDQYNCHGFVYLDAMAWLNDPTPVIEDNDYYVPTNPRIGDAVVYTTDTLSLNDERRPIITSTPPHSGLVTRGSPGSPTEVTSKWGSWHIYKHAPTDVWSEYGQPTYLRSDRSGGHTVNIT